MACDLGANESLAGWARPIKLKVSGLGAVTHCNSGNEFFQKARRRVLARERFGA